MGPQHNMLGGWNGCASPDIQSPGFKPDKMGEDDLHHKQCGTRKHLPTVVGRNVLLVNESVIPLLGAYMLSAYIHVNPNQFLFIL